MITFRKLSSLSEGTRRRKTLALLGDFESACAAGTTIDSIYLRALLNSVHRDSFWPESLREEATVIQESLPAGLSACRGDNVLRRGLNGLRHAMATALGRDWADWNAAMPGDSIDAVDRNTRPLRIYLDGLRSPFNVGSIMRTALAFNAERLWVSPEGTSPEHRRCRRSAMGAVDILPWSTASLDSLDSDTTGKVFSLELGGTDIRDFEFPVSGTVILGSEELGVSPEALVRAEASGGIVSIPLPGPKASLNVAVAFGILMEDWYSSLLFSEEQ